MMDERLLRADAIVFDVGNVLLGFDISKVTLLIPPEIRFPLTDAMFGDRNMWSAFDVGLESNESIAARIAAAAGLPEDKDTVLRVLSRFPEIMSPLPLSDLLDDLRARGKRLYALTNYPEPSFTYTVERFPFLKDKLNGAVVSAREKLVKPDPAIFRLLIDRYQIQPEKSLFIDDLAANVAAAEQVGFRGWHYAGNDTL